MKAELPKFNETFNPILAVLSDGEIIHTREMQKKVIEKYYSTLPKELLNVKTKSGEILIYNRIAWGKSYLKKGGYIHYPSRGFVQITAKGLAHKNHLNIKELARELRAPNPGVLKKNPQIMNLSNASPQDLIDEGVKQMETEIKEELLNRVKALDPYYFEKVILLLLNKMGYGEFIETPKSNDGGVDGIIDEDRLGLEKIYIQGKRYTENKVREKDIRNFIGAMSGDTNKGIFVTTSTFDVKAVEKVKSAHHKIILIDGFKLVDLLLEYNIGVQIKSTYDIKQIDEEFFIES